MRRVFSILLVLYLGLGPLTAAFQDGEDARLPICCRRHGSHHCAMPGGSLARIMQAASGKTPLIGAPAHCPQYPGTAPANVLPVHALSVAGVCAFPLSAQEQERLPFRFAPLTRPTGTDSVRGPPLAVLI